MATAKERLDNAALWLVFDQPLLQEFVDYIKLTEDKTIPTAGVRMDHNYIQVYYNPDFIDSLDDEGARFVMMHELYHVIMAHVFHRLPQLVVDNMAADMEINQSPMCEPPSSLKGNLQTPDQYSLPRGETREFYYKKLMEKFKDVKCNGDCANCQMNEGKDGKGPKMPCPAGKKGKDNQGSFDSHGNWGEHQQDVEEVWKDRVKEAVESAKQKGNLPGGLEEQILAKWKKHRQLGKLLKRVIGKQISVSVQEASYWRRKNKRFAAYPGTREIYGPKFAIGIDTSGSMSDKDLEEVYSVVKWIKRMGYEAKLLQCDCDISDVTDLTKLKGKIRLRGRGGTSSLPVFQWIEKNAYKPDMLIFFTDMYTDFPDKAPPYKVVWVDTANGQGSKPPFGRVLAQV